MDLDDIFGPYNEIKDDLKFIISSDIKVKTIISLKEGQKKLGDLKKEVHTNSSTILHNLSQLESRNLIKKEFQDYSLSQTGEIASIILIDTITIFSVIKKNKDFWLNHKINGIPDHLIDKIENLDNFKITKRTIGDLTITYKESLLNSRNIKCIFPTNGFNEFIIEMLDLNKHIELILTKKSSNELSSRLKLNSKIDDEKNLKLYKINKLELLLIVTNDLLWLNLPSECGSYNFEEFLINENEEAVEWGNQLFNYYLNEAKELKGI